MRIVKKKKKGKNRKEEQTARSTVLGVALLSFYFYIFFLIDILIDLFGLDLEQLGVFDRAALFLFGLFCHNKILFCCGVRERYVYKDE